jgi:hypothetical protein
MSSLSFSWQRILTQELSFRITRKSPCHFLFNHLVMPTLLNSTQFSNLPVSVSLISNSLYDWNLLVRILNSTASQSHIATDGQSVSQYVLVTSLIWGSWPDIYYCWTVTALFLWGALSDERTGLSFVYASGVFLGSESLGTRDHILLSEFRDFHFRRLLRLAGLRWRYSNPLRYSVTSLYSRGTDHTENTSSVRRVA